MLEHTKRFVSWTLGRADATTQTTDAERNCIARHVAGQKRVAEVGVWQGVTTKRLRGAMDPAGVLYAIDPFPPGPFKVRYNKIIAHTEVDRVRTARVEWLQMTGEDAARHLAREEPLDFVFIDGDHTYDGLRVDWEGFFPLMRPGGILALHDSHPTDHCPESAGSVRYTRDVILKEPRAERIELVGCLSIIKKKPD